MTWLARMAVAGALLSTTISLQPAIAQAIDPAAGRISVSLGQDVLSLDPSRDTTIPGLNLALSVFDQLVVLAPDASVENRLATQIEKSDDAKTWTVTVRDDVKFHNGDPLTIDDVVWTFRRIMDDPKALQRAYLSRVDTVEKLDGNRIRFNLTEPFVPFDRQLSLISILPQKAYEEMGESEFSLKPVGSGAYKVDHWTKDSEIKLVANEEYWRGAPSIKEVYFKPIPAEAARVSALLSGQVDIVPVLPPSLVDRVASNDSLTVEKVLSNRATFLGFNHANPVLSDIRIRQAIDMAIDRDSLTQHLLRGGGVPIGQVGSPAIFGFDESIEPTAFDPERAKELIAEAGYDGSPIPFDFPTNRLALGSEVAEAIAGYLREVGLNVEMRGAEFTAFYPAWFNQQFEGIFFYGIGMSSMDSDLLISFQYASGSGKGYWSSEEVDKLYAEQRAEVDPAKRQALLSRIWQISKDEVVYAPLYAEVQSYGVRKGIEWSPRADERLRFDEASLKAE